MKRSPGKKFLEPGESVICIHNKVNLKDRSSKRKWLITRNNSCKRKWVWSNSSAGQILDLEFGSGLSFAIQKVNTMELLKGEDTLLANRTMESWSGIYAKILLCKIIAEGWKGYFWFFRPNRVSVHGINGDHLLKPECDYPFWKYQIMLLLLLHDFRTWIDFNNHQSLLSQLVCCLLRNFTVA